MNDLPQGNSNGNPPNGVIPFQAMMRRHFSPEPKISTGAKVIGRVSRVTGVNPADIIGPSKTQRTFRARQFVSAILRKEHGWSYPRIGRLLNRHHSTIIECVRAYERSVSK
jgi:chromosomal replication initiation ATPase DnaA